MFKNKIYQYAGIAFVCMLYAACKIPAIVEKTENKNLPANYANASDTSGNGRVKWKEYFTDPYLVTLIDTALKNNQELNITLQEIAITRNEIRARKGEYLPFVGIRGGAGAEKVARYT